MRKYEKSCEKFKGQKTTVTDDAITIETDVEKVTTKWQEVCDITNEYGYITFKNGNNTYFFIERSMSSEHVTQLKEILIKKTAPLV